MSDEPTGPGLPISERTAFDALLESERNETSNRLAGLERQLDAIVEAGALSVSDDEHDPEGATLGFERAQVTALVGEARQHLDAVDRLGATASRYLWRLRAMRVHDRHRADGRPPHRPHVRGLRGRCRRGDRSDQLTGLRMTTGI